ELVDDARSHARASRDFVEALILASGRLLDEHRFEEILPLAEEAVAAAAELGDPMLTLESKSWRAVGLLFRESFDEAFDILDAELPLRAGSRSSRAFLAFGTRSVSYPDEPKLEALYELSEIVGYALIRQRDGTYVRAVGAIAERYSGTEHAVALNARFERALAKLRRGSDWPTQLRTIVEQAEQRQLPETAAAARRALDR
nr:hypothetical protein [Deltaproteobacteria bacterium]